jgi:putative ABC transport system permease protein
VFRNYLSAALRNLAHNRLYSVINIAGLAMGLAAAIYIGLFVREELSYDRFFPGYQNVYRISMTYVPADGAPVKCDCAYTHAAEWLQTDFPSIEAVGRLNGDWHSLRHGEIEAHEAITYADPGFFQVFPLKTLAGDLRTALNDPLNVVLTRKLARKFFGSDTPVGQILELDRQHLLKVTAVVEDLPSTTHLAFGLVVSSRAPTSPMVNAEKIEKQYKLGFVPGLADFTYFRVKPGAAAQAIERQLPAFTRRHIALPPGERVDFHIVPVTKIHLLPAGSTHPLKLPGDSKMVRAAVLIGVFILVIAGLNFVNLMTARAAQRAVEVGVRKASGARARDLMLQFIGESILYVAAGMLIAVALVEIFMPSFNALLDRSQGKYTAPDIAFEYWRDPVLAGILLASVLLIGVAAGAYPAFVLARFRPAAALKGGIRASGSFNVRQMLVVVQFVILVLLILSTAVIQRQTLFAMNEGLRIDHEQVLLVFFKDPKVRETVQNAISGLPGVRGVTSSATAPTNFGTMPQQVRREDGTFTTLQFTPVDYNFHAFYGLPLLAGRYLSRDHGTDTISGSLNAVTTASFIINESAARKLGFTNPAKAIGSEIKLDLLPSQAAQTIVGVVPDYPVDSVRVPIEPTVYYVNPDQLIMISARLSGQNIPETLARIDDVWRKVGERRAIPRQFLDEYYEYLYSGVQQQAKIFKVFSVIAVLIGCLGLFGLSVFAAQRRTKEIGIRKAMGASNLDILRFLLWQFGKPVLWANVIALPLGAYLMHRWLETFVYRVRLEPWLIFASGLLAIVIALLTVGIHSYRVARRNPVVALRYE